MCKLISTDEDDDMNATAKNLVRACVAAGAVFSSIGISTTAEAGGWFDDNPVPFSAICQSAEELAKLSTSERSK
jgi:hypothetical protein